MNLCLTVTVVRNINISFSCTKVMKNVLNNVRHNSDTEILGGFFIY